MIKIELSNKILNKHKQYLINKSGIKESLNKLKDEDFFDSNYVQNILKSYKGKNEEKKIKINKFQDELKKKISSIDKVDYSNNEHKQVVNYVRYLNNEHKQFIQYIIDEVEGLKDYDINENREILEGENYNIFLADPKGLDYIEKNEIRQNFYCIKKIFEIESVLASGNNNLKKCYTKSILDTLGYKKFSAEEMEVYYRDEYELLISLKNRDFFGTYLEKYNIIEEQVKGKKVSAQTLNLVKCKIIEDITKLNIEYKDDELSKALKKLAIDIANIDTADSKNESIGKVKFISEVNKYAKKIVISELIIDQPILIYDFNKYSDYIEKKGKGDMWGAYQFVIELGIETCPYCNRQYISPIYYSKGKLRADLDHFLPKYKYPYFSMSIFNLVPSCKGCNSSLKGSTEFTYEQFLNPYESGFDNLLKFTYDISSYKSAIAHDSIKVKFKSNIKPNSEVELYKKAKNNEEVFQLENLYNYHRKEVKELIYKKIIYSDSYIESLKNQYKNLFSSNEEVTELVLGTDFKVENFHKRPLSKLRKDICEELGFGKHEISNDSIRKLKDIVKLLSKE